MRVIVTCLIGLCCVGTAAAQPGKTTQADFLVGQITGSRASQIEIDLGYVHGFKLGQKFALFRSESLAWSPVGVVEATIVGASRSKVRVAKGSAPIKGDLVLVAYSTLGHVSNKWREEFYMSRRILLSQYKNGYDTLDLERNTRQLASQKLAGRRWYKDGAETGVRLIYGATKDAYESEKVRRLGSQCQLLKEFQEESPGALKSLSARWTQVLSEVTGHIEPPKKEKSGAEEGDGAADVETDLEFANNAAKNLLPRVNREFPDEPLAVRELYAVIVGSVAINPPANTQAYIRAHLERSQFPNIAFQPETLKSLETFVNSVE